MNMNEFELLVLKMREAQKAYFKSRDQYNLRQAKITEAMVDSYLEQLQEPATSSQQPTLWT